MTPFMADTGGYSRQSSNIEESSNSNDENWLSGYIKQK